MLLDQKESSELGHAGNENHFYSEISSFVLFPFFFAHRSAPFLERGKNDVFFF